MRRLLLTLAGLLALLAPHANAQDDQVGAELFVRQAGDRVRAAIQVQVQDAWHMYHTDLGPGSGMPTLVELEADNVEWGPPVLPKPYRHDEPMLGTWSWAHHGTVVIRMEGRVSGGEPGDVTGALEGMACEDKVNGVCILFDLPLEDAGAGPDELFDDWATVMASAGTPAGATPAAAAEAPSAPSATGTGGGGLGLRPSFLEDEEEQLEADEFEAALYTRTTGDVIEAALVFEIEEGWHLYHHTLGDPEAVAIPTEIELRGEGVEWGAVRWPEPKREQYDDFWVWAHEGTVVLRATGRITGIPSGVAARVTGQVCELVCLQIALTLEPAGPGEDRFFAADVAGTAVAGPAAGAGSAPDGTTRPSGEGDAPVNRAGGTSESKSLLGFILAAIAGGIFALLMPCTYPMIPITISFFTKQAEARGGKILPLSLAYGAGIVLIFILIGVVIGPVILAFATHPVTNLVIGAVFVLFALALFGVWTLQPPRFLMSAAGKASMRGGYGGVFLMGTALVVTSFTCTAPFVGSLLSIGATAGDGIWRIAVGMGFFGLTMAVPFVFLSLVPGRIQAMPQSGEWMHVLKVSLGFVELAAALKFFSNADLVWNWGILSREVFLLMWAGIFAVAAFFLFGKIHLKNERADEIGAGRMVSGLGALLLSLYCLHGYAGHELDTVMTAITPNYSTRVEHAGGNGAEPGAPVTPRDHTIVVDDYAAARALAAERGAPLLINFTGFT